LGGGVGDGRGWGWLSVLREGERYLYPCTFGRLIEEGMKGWMNIDSNTYIKKIK
jgi:hypothetical protein